MNFKRGRAGAWTVLTMSVALAACASGVPDRAPIDARAAIASTAGEHRAAASEYQSLGEREIEASLRDAARSRDDERTTALMNQGRATLGHPWITEGHWRMRALTEAREAEEATALAKEHRDMAIASDASQTSPRSR